MLTDNELFLTVEITGCFLKSQQISKAYASQYHFCYEKIILDTSSLSSYYMKWNTVTGQRSTGWMYIYVVEWKNPNKLVCPTALTCTITLLKTIVSTHTEDSIYFVNTKVERPAKILTAVCSSDTMLTFTSVTNQICRGQLLWTAGKLYLIFISSIKADIYEIL